MLYDHPLRLGGSKDVRSGCMSSFECVYGCLCVCVCVCVCVCMCVCVSMFVGMCVFFQGGTERSVSLRTAWKEFRRLVGGFSRFFAEDVLVCKKLVKNIHFFVVVENEKFFV